MSGEDPAVTRFREYVRIVTVHPTPDYDTCTAFLKKQAESLDLPFKVLECAPGHPICIMTWEGLEPSLPSVMLNSHTDVVPVFEEHWTYPPFSAHKDEQGNIYGRGTQDMKCVGMQHLEAVRRHKEAGRRFKRTIHLTFVAEEELGGTHAMGLFVDTDEFKKMNVGFGMDEGIAVPDDVVPVYYGERHQYWIEVTFPGSPGHGSRFVPDNAALKAHAFTTKLLEYRGMEKYRLDCDPNLTLGDVTTVNLNIMNGGVQPNVVPDKFTLTFDCRVRPTLTGEEWESMLEAWMKEAGDDLSIKYLQRQVNPHVTCTDPSDKWFSVLIKAFEKHNVKTRNEIFPAGTDSRYLRRKGIPAIGFSPMPNTPTLLHDHNEFLNENVFLKGIQIFEDIVANLASV